MLLAAIVFAASPSPAPSPPLKEIGHVRTSVLCSALRHNIFPAVAGLKLNDDLIDKGRMMMQKTADDAAANAGSAAITGGAGAGSEMDNFQLGILSSDLAKNLVKIEAFLADAHAFPKDPSTEDERMLALAKSSLEAVASRQRATLNVLSATAEINSANDVRAQRDIIPYEHDMSGPQTPPFTPISMPDALATDIKLTQASEVQVTPVVRPIVAIC